MAQVYLETAKQTGFDGPYLIELTIMLLLSKVYPSLSATPAYRRYFHDLRGSDLARARQLTEDPYMLIKFKVGAGGHPSATCIPLAFAAAGPVGNILSAFTVPTWIGNRLSALYSCGCGVGAYAMLSSHWCTLACAWEPLHHNVSGRTT